MNAKTVRVRKLAGWKFDDYEYRPKVFDCAKVAEATQRTGQRQWLQRSEVLLAQETSALRDAPLAQASRADLVVEMFGLEWSLGVVDLHSLIAFQRRLFFNPQVSLLPAPAAGDWPALTTFSFGPAKAVECELAHDATAHTIVLRSTNPNLHFRTSQDAAAPLSIQAGSPFFEVVCFRGRWFLRDGYHLAYTLLQAGVFAVPAVIVQARTMEELGATQPWFYPEEVLFSEAPPLVADFLEQDLVLDL